MNQTLRPMQRGCHFQMGKVHINLLSSILLKLWCVMRCNTAYSYEELIQIEKVLHRAAVRTVDKHALRDQLSDLLVATGLFTSNEYDQAFQELTDTEPSHAILAKVYKSLATGTSFPTQALSVAERSMLKTTLSVELATVYRRRSGPHQPQINVTVHPSVAIRCEDGTALPSIVSDLWRRHRRQIRPGAPTKRLQDSLLIELADIYLEFTGSDSDRYSLPHSKESLFIEFVRATLAPFFAVTEVSSSALASRWRRLKECERLAQSR